MCYLFQLRFSSFLFLIYLFISKLFQLLFSSFLFLIYLVICKLFQLLFFPHSSFLFIFLNVNFFNCFFSSFLFLIYLFISKLFQLLFFLIPLSYFDFNCCLSGTLLSPLLWESCQLWVSRLEIFTGYTISYRIHRL